MLGSVSEANDALQEAWLRIHDEDPAGVENLQAWLTTVVGRICLNMLRSRRIHEQSSDVHVPDPVVVLEGTADPAQQILVADSIGLALQVVLDSLNPAERLAFVLHDVFGIPFSDIAGVLDRSEPPPSNSRAEDADVAGARLNPTPISNDSGRWSTLSLPLRTTATSKRSWPFSIQISN